MTETLAHGFYSSESTQRELSNEYQYDMIKMIFKNRCVRVLWTKVASGLKGLMTMRMIVIMNMMMMMMMMMIFMMMIIIIMMANFEFGLLIVVSGSAIPRLNCEWSDEGNRRTALKLYHNEDDGDDDDKEDDIDDDDDDHDDDHDNHDGEL